MYGRLTPRGTDTDIPRGHHREYGDDGAECWHKGYQKRRCTDCGIDFIVGRMTYVTACGLENCDTKQGDVKRDE